MSNASPPVSVHPSETLVEINRAWFRTQTDIIKSGLLREIGPNAFAVWSVIKAHADFSTGLSWPGARLLQKITGMQSKTVQSAIKTLLAAHLLRIEEPGKGTRSTRYVAQERLDVWLGKRRVCTVVVDYIPARVHESVQAVDAVLKGKVVPPEALARCRIIPGEGFRWDSETQTLEADIQIADIVDKSVDMLLK